MNTAFRFLLFGSVLLPLMRAAAPAPRQREALGRGVVALKLDHHRNFVSRRVLGLDSDALAFNLDRAAGSDAPTKRHLAPLHVRNFTDATAVAEAANADFVRPILAGVEQR